MGLLLAPSLLNFGRRKTGEKGACKRTRPGRDGNGTLRAFRGVSSPTRAYGRDGVLAGVVLPSSGSAIGEGAVQPGPLDLRRRCEGGLVGVVGVPVFFLSQCARRGVPATLRRHLLLELYVGALAVSRRHP